MSAAQELRVLPGAWAIDLLPADAPLPADGWMALVRGPDGLTVVREAGDGAWRALWSGDTAHAPEATGMLAALVRPLADAAVPVMVASTHGADLVLVPADRLADAIAALRGAGHTVRGA